MSLKPTKRQIAERIVKLRREESLLTRQIQKDLDAGKNVHRYELERLKSIRKMLDTYRKVLEEQNK